MEKMKEKRKKGRNHNCEIWIQEIKLLQVGIFHDKVQFTSERKKKKKKEEEKMKKKSAKKFSGNIVEIKFFKMYNITLLISSTEYEN